MLKALKRRIETKQARVSVIGLGYVGLPVACSFAQAGFDVLGVDIAEDRVRKINSGISPIEGSEPGLRELVLEVTKTGKLKATNDYAELINCDVVLIAVETPVGEDKKPQYKALRNALRRLSPVLKPGALVIVESTVAPGTMDNFIIPILERGGERLNLDFFLGNCPERVMPGRLLHNLRNMDRVVGGMTQETAQAMVMFYRQIVPKAALDATDCITAELVKTIENAYRDVQIAFANEVAMISEAVGGDVWKVRELVNKSPGRLMLMPGAGVGGHCIPKDPWLLAHGVDGRRLTLRIIPAAREVNDKMPAHIAHLLRKAIGHLVKKRILVLGYSYLENSDDIRNSPTAQLVDELLASGAFPVIHDPFVSQYKGDVLTMAVGCDAVVLMVKHTEYGQLDLGKLAHVLKSRILIDGRGFFKKDDLDKAGFAFHQLGVGRNTTKRVESV